MVACETDIEYGFVSSKGVRPRLGLTAGLLVFGLAIVAPGDRGREADDLPRRRARRTPPRRRRSASSASRRSDPLGQRDRDRSAARTPASSRATRATAARASCPTTPFTQGESVSVTVGVRGPQPVRFEFTVAHLGPTPAAAQPHHARSRTSSQHFVSRARPARRRRSPSPGSPEAADAATSSSRRCPRRSSIRAVNNAITIHPVGPGGPMIVDGHGRRRLVQAARRRPTSPPTSGSSATAAAGAHLVAGPGDRRGVRPRRGRDRRPLLPHARDRPRRQRLPDGHPRVRADPGRRRALHDLLAGA